MHGHGCRADRRSGRILGTADIGTEDLRAFGNLGGGVVPQNIEDVQGRSLRVTLEYKFR